MKNKVYSFSTDDAVKYGIDAAIILHNMRYWLDYARAHGENEHEGYYWMYCTASKMTEIFPFWTANKIQKLLKKLEDCSVLIGGNYSRSKFDRTKWYSMQEFSIQPNGGMRSSETADCTFSETAESLYSKKDRNNDVNNNIDRAFDIFWSAGMKKLAKPKALTSFKKALKDSDFKDPIAFANHLANDIRTRQASGQFGFDKMHPTTYLNQQRWNDDYETVQPRHNAPSNDGLSDSKRAILEARARRDANQQNSGFTMGENGRALLD